MSRIYGTGCVGDRQYNRHLGVVVGMRWRRRNPTAGRIQNVDDLDVADVARAQLVQQTRRPG